MTRNVIAAGTSFPNTPESDAQPQVYHDVTVGTPEGGTEVVRLMAEDPMDAMNRVRRMADDAYGRLQRISQT